MIVNNGDYLVYCHTLPNNKHYIGITKQKLNRRFQIGTGIKKVRCITTDKTFDSIKDACLFYKCNQKHMSETINGTRNFNGVYNGLKLKWEYVVN